MIALAWLGIAFATAVVLRVRRRPRSGLGVRLAAVARILVGVAGVGSVLAGEWGCTAREASTTPAPVSGPAAQAADSTGGEEPLRFAGAFAIPYVLCDCDPALTVLQTTRAVAGYADADTSSRVVRMLPAGAFIEPALVDTYLTVVVRPGEAVLRDTLTLDARRYGPVRVLPSDEDAGTDVRLSLAAGDRLEYIESDWDFGFVRVGGVVYGTHMQNLEDDRVEWMRRVPEAEVWSRLAATATEPAAWVRQYGRLDEGAPATRPFCESATGRRADCVRWAE